MTATDDFPWITTSVTSTGQEPPAKTPDHHPPPAVDADPSLTLALAELSAGTPGAADRVMPIVYARLHELAESQLRRQSPGHTLQPTALVNEAYIKLLGHEHDPGPRWQSRAHFFAVAATAMRHILVDHARARNRAKRTPADPRRTPLENLESPVPADALDLADLDEALTRLGESDPLGARVTEMRFFAGMEMNDIATVLGVSERTVRRYWVFAKAWLCRELQAPSRNDAVP